jgi:hypothetical protein
MAFYNITSATATNSDVIITITECDAAGASSPEANYSFAVYKNPVLYYAPGDAQVAPRFQFISQASQRSPILTMDNVIELTGSAHGAATTVALATELAVIISS